MHSKAVALETIRIRFRLLFLKLFPTAEYSNFLDYRMGFDVRSLVDSSGTVLLLIK